jgi:MerR family mercuric resistance operon transcriptional regulator
MNKLTIGQVAREAGVNIQTIRYYERRGLLPEPPRGDSGYRYYGEEAVKHIRFIRNAKELGFSLKEIGELLSLRLDPEGMSAAVKELAKEKLTDIEDKIDTLQRIRAALEGLIQTCPGCGPVQECPILDALDT